MQAFCLCPHTVVSLDTVSRPEQKSRRPPSASLAHADPVFLVSAICTRMRSRRLTGRPSRGLPLLSNCKCLLLWVSWTSLAPHLSPGARALSAACTMHVCAGGHGCCMQTTKPWCLPPLVPWALRSQTRASNTTDLCRSVVETASQTGLSSWRSFGEKWG